MKGRSPESPLMPLGHWGSLSGGLSSKLSNIYGSRAHNKTAPPFGGAVSVHVRSQATREPTGLELTAHRRRKVHDRDRNLLRREEDQLRRVVGTIEVLEVRIRCNRSRERLRLVRYGRNVSQVRPYRQRVRRASSNNEGLITGREVPRDDTGAGGYRGSRKMVTFAPGC